MWEILDEGWFNIFFTNEFVISKTTVIQHFHADTDIYRSTRWKSRVKAVFKLGKKAYFDASLYRVSNYFEKKKLSDFYSMDMNAALRMGNKKWQGEIKFRVVNPFDNSVFQQFTISDYYQNQFQLETAPRFFIVTWDTSF